MKYYLITPTGETGPYLPAQINRMFSRQEITGAQLCRPENSANPQRLDQVFRHLRAAPANYVPPPPSTEATLSQKIGGAILFTLTLGAVQIIRQIIKVEGPPPKELIVAGAAILLLVPFVIRFITRRKRRPTQESPSSHP